MRGSRHGIDFHVSSICDNELDAIQESIHKLNNDTQCKLHTFYTEPLYIRRDNNV